MSNPQSSINNQNQYPTIIRILDKAAESNSYLVEISVQSWRDFPARKVNLDPDVLQAFEAVPEEYGKTLGKALFAPEALGSDYRQILIHLQANQQRLCLRLRVDCAELHDLAWERLYHPVGQTWEPLALANSTPFARYLLPPEFSSFWRAAHRPLKMLVIMASPTNLSDYGLDPISSAERQILRQFLNSLPNVQATYLESNTEKPPTLTQIRRYLHTDFQVMHVLCHGATTDSKTFLYLEDDEGEVKVVSAEDLVSTLQTRKNPPSLCFLAACESAKRARADGFLALGPRLVHEVGITAVIAMREKISMSTAAQFTEYFYTRLLKHGLVDLAANEAREMVRDRWDWSVPVLFTHSLNGRLLPSQPVGKSSLLFAERLPNEFVPRPEITEPAVKHLLARSSICPIVSLVGLNGFGKSTLATAICRDGRVRDAFPDGILWVTFGRGFDNPIGLIDDWIYELSGERSNYRDVQTAARRLRTLLAERQILLVIDNVRNRDEMAHFLPDNNPLCACLITTETRRLVPDRADQIDVPSMSPNQARALLEMGITDETTAIDQINLRQMLDLSGRWPVLLKLIKATLYERQNLGITINEAITEINEELIGYGITAFDPMADSVQAEQATGAIVSMSLGRLDDNEMTCYKDLLIFPADIEIPISVLEKWWAVTANLSSLATKRHYRNLYALSLVQDINPDSIRLPSVILQYLLPENRESVEALHRQFLAQCFPQGPVGHSSTFDWSGLLGAGLVAAYFWDYLTYHLVEAGYKPQLLNVVKDLHFVACKAFYRGALSLLEDFDLAIQQAPDDPILELLGQIILQIAHLLNKCLSVNDVVVALCSRLGHLPELHLLTDALAQEKQPHRLYPWYSLPDLAHPALKQTLVGHTRFVHTCVIGSEGLLVSGSEDKTLKLWDINAGMDIETLCEHEKAVLACAMSPDNRFIISASKDKTIKLWPYDQDTKSVGSPKTLFGHHGAVQSCVISSDGGNIVSASNDGSLRLWDVLSGTERIIGQHRLPVWDCAVSSDSTFVVSASKDTTLKVWDLQKGEILHTLQGHTGPVHCCAIDPTDGIVVSGGQDQRLLVWNLPDGSLSYAFEAHSDWVLDCAFSPDGKYLASASRDGTIKLWDISQGVPKTAVAVLIGHAEAVSCCAFSKDGDLLFSASFDGTLKVWQMSGIGARTTLALPTVTDVNACAVCTGGAWAATVSDDMTVQIWDMEAGSIRQTFSGHTGKVRACAISPDGMKLVSASADRTLIVWDTQEQKQILHLTGHKACILTCAISPDGRTLASGAADKMIKIWDIPTGMCQNTLTGHKGWVEDCVFSPDGRSIMSASRDKTIRIWDVQTGQCLNIMKAHMRRVYGIAISQSGQTLVTASQDTTLKVWDWTNGEVTRTLIGHTASVTDCAISPDDQLLASTSSDGTIRIWDLQTGNCLTTFPVDGRLFDCVWLPDGERLLAVGERGAYFLWYVS